MSIWVYNDTANHSEPVLQDYSCQFCMTALVTIYQQKLSRHMPPELNRQERVEVCPTCGWWKAIRERRSIVDIEFKFYRKIRIEVEAAVASLRELDLSKLNTPINEVRSYLTAKYDARFSIHPRLFEETVASVFKSLGYQTVVTGYTGDDGIDVILEQDDRQIGIQVKRYKNRIEVEQIRSLAGALVLSGLTEGIFVTTSAFQSGANGTIDRYAALEKPIAIQLMDAKRFFDALKFAQRSMYGSHEEIDWDNCLKKMKSITSSIRGVGCGQGERNPY